MKAPNIAQSTLPKMERKTIESPFTEKNNTYNATPNVAPELIPRIDGPANGFRNNVCINKPETPKATPTKTDVIALGNLISKK